MKNKQKLSNSILCRMSVILIILFSYAYWLELSEIVVF